MRAVKLIALSVAGLVAIALIVAAILILRFDPNDYKTRVTSLAEARTGRSVEIADDIQWSLFPWLAIETGGITVGNNPDYGPAPFATIERISARVRVWPLLRRRVELGQITIDGFALDVGTNADGVASWADLLGDNAAAAAATPTEPAGSVPALADLHIAGIALRNGRILWRDSGEVRYVISDAGLTTGPVELDAPVEVKAGFSVLDVPTQRSVRIDTATAASLSGSVVNLGDVEIMATAMDAAGAERGRARLETESVMIEGGRRITAAAGTVTGTASGLPIGADEIDAEVRWPGFVVDLDAGTARLDGLTASVNGVTTTLTLDASDLGGTPRVNGRADLASVPAERLLALLAVDVPAEIDPAAIGNVSGHGMFATLPDGTVTFDDLTVGLLGLSVGFSGRMGPSGTLSGDLNVPAFAPTPAFRSLVAANAPVRLDDVTSVALATHAAIPLEDAASISLTGLVLTLDRAKLEGTLTIQPPPGRSYGGELSLTVPDPGLIRGLAGDAFPANLEPGALGATSLKARFDYAEDSDRLTFDDTRLAAFGLIATGNGWIEKTSTAPIVHGNGALARFDPGVVLTRLGQPVPQTSDPAAFKSAEFRGDFVIDATKADFTNMTVAIDGTPITGSLSVANFDSPSYRFDLAADKLDVDRYLPPAAEDAADGQRKAGDIELASEPLELLDLVGSARVGALRLAGLDFQQVGATLTVGAGRARIAPAHAALYGGQFDGTLAVDTTGEAPTMQLTGKATTVAIAPLVTALTGESNVSGTGNFDLDLAGTGQTVTDTLRTAAGTMSFALTSGAIDGFNLGRTLCAAFNLRQKLPQPAAAARKTDYTVIRATANVANGIAATEDLTAQTNFMTVDGSGRMNLADAQVDYDLRAKLTASVPISGCESMIDSISGSIPFTVEGPLSGPDIEPDYREIIRDRVRDNVEERLRNNLQDRLRNLL